MTIPKYLCIPLLALSISACNNGMTNDEIIAETKKCQEAGLRVLLLLNAFTLELERIECVSPIDKKNKRENP